MPTEHPIRKKNFNKKYEVISCQIYVWSFNVFVAIKNDSFRFFLRTWKRRSLKGIPNPVHTIVTAWQIRPLTSAHACDDGSILEYTESIVFFKQRNSSSKFRHALKHGLEMKLTRSRDFLVGTYWERWGRDARNRNSRKQGDEAHSAEWALLVSLAPISCTYLHTEGAATASLSQLRRHSAEYDFPQNPKPDPNRNILGCRVVSHRMWPCKLQT